MDWTEQKILKALNRDLISSPKYILHNLYVFNWESDYLVMTPSWYYYEAEIKISRSDFKADFQKKEKHQILSDGSKTFKPNYFYYAVPENLIDISEVPEYAGLIYINETNRMTIKKTAPKLHTHKLQIDLQDKFYYNWRSERQSKREVERNQASFAISKYRKSCENAIKDKYWPKCKLDNNHCNLQCERGRLFSELVKGNNF